MPHYEMMKYRAGPPVHSTGGAAFGVQWKNLMPSLSRAWNGEMYDEDLRANRKVYEKTASQLTAMDSNEPPPKLTLQGILYGLTQALAAFESNIGTKAQILQANIAQNRLNEPVDLSSFSVDWNKIVGIANPFLIGPRNIGLSDQDTEQMNQLISEKLMSGLVGFRAAVIGSRYNTAVITNYDVLSSNDPTKNIITMIEAKNYMPVPFGPQRNLPPGVQPAAAVAAAPVKAAPVMPQMGPDGDQPMIDLSRAAANRAKLARRQQRALEGDLPDYLPVPEMGPPGRAVEENVADAPPTITSVATSPSSSANLSQPSASSSAFQTPLSNISSSSSLSPPFRNQLLSTVKKPESPAPGAVVPSSSQDLMLQRNQAQFDRFKPSNAPRQALVDYLARKFPNYKPGKLSQKAILSELAEEDFELPDNWNVFTPLQSRREKSPGAAVRRPPPPPPAARDKPSASRFKSTTPTGKLDLSAFSDVSKGKGRWTDYGGPDFAKSTARVFKNMDGAGRHKQARPKSAPGFMNFHDEYNDTTNVGNGYSGGRSEMMNTENREAHLDQSWKGLPKRLGAEARYKKMRGVGLTKPRETY